MKLWFEGYEVNADVTYHKQSLRNRYSILGVNGIIWLTIPVESTKGITTPIRDIRIAGNDWRRVHWRTLQSAYARAAFWEHYNSKLQRIYAQEQKFLIDLHIEILEWINSAGISQKRSYSTQQTSDLLNEALWEPNYIWPAQTEYPQVFSDRHPFQSNLSIIDLLMNLGPKATMYIDKVVIHGNSATNHSQ
jgi:hypothetical protein